MIRYIFIFYVNTSLASKVSKHKKYLILCLDIMYNQANARQSRANNGWKKRPFNAPRTRRGRFLGDAIDINLFINKAEIIETAEIYVPKNSFADFAISEKIKQTIARHGYDVPTPIQDQAIPCVLAGRDVIGLANTGTGKTAAFLIPMINKVLFNPAEKILIVVPTRELAAQIQDEFSLFARGLNIFSVVVVGGASIGRQISGLRSRYNFVIGTPGRLKDLVARKNLDLSQFSNVILDEADRMLDMGFIGDIKLLLSLITKKKQTLLFSATFGAEIENLAKNFLLDPIRISINTKKNAQAD